MYRPPKNYDERHYQKIKSDAIRVYSAGANKCFCCGEDHLEFLGVVCVNDSTSLRGKELYSSLTKQGYPSGFAVMCKNCASVKMCPHERERKVRVQNVKKEI